MFKVRTLILIVFVALLINFSIGLIHPYVVLSFEVFRPLLILFAIVILVLCIVRFIQDLYKSEKMIFSNLLKIALCCILTLIFTNFNHYISFVGLRVHYWLVRDYDTIRAWANDVELPDENGLIYMNGVDIPESARPFHPENVWVKEEHGIRKLELSWNSGMMQVDWSLIILPPEEIYQPKNGMLTKIVPGVYLHYQFFKR